MKALCLQDYNKLELIDMPKPRCAPDEVLIRVKACAICGSDVHGFAGRTNRRIPPVVMGHEAAGYIEEIGSMVRRYKPGDRVVFNSSLFCGSCSFCRRGMENLCTDAKVYGVHCDTYRLDGAMAQYLCVPERILYRLPETLDYVHGALIEPLSIALHAVMRTPLKMHETAAVVGSGPIGMMLIKALRAAGVRRVAAIDIDESRLTLAQKAGAVLCINSAEEDPAQRIAEACGSLADHAFEAVGAAATLNTAIDCVRTGGTVTVVGNAVARGEIAFQKIVLKELTLYGSYACANEYELALSTLADGQIEIDDILSLTAPLEQAQDLFERLAARKKGLLKVVLTLD